MFTEYLRAKSAPNKIIEMKPHTSRGFRYPNYAKQILSGSENEYDFNNGTNH